MPLPAVEPGVPTEIELGNRARLEEVIEPEEAKIAGEGPEAGTEQTKATGDEEECAEAARTASERRRA